jgi:hypothetical protein
MKEPTVVGGENYPTVKVMMTNELRMVDTRTRMSSMEGTSVCRAREKQGSSGRRELLRLPSDEGGCRQSCKVRGGSGMEEDAATAAP